MSTKTKDQLPTEQPADEVQAELGAAKAELAEVERQYAETLATLERAVADADVAAVSRLRGEAEVALPQQLGAARIRLLAVRVAEAEQEVAGSDGRIREAQERSVAAQCELEDASERLSKATGGYHGAKNLLSLAKSEAVQAAVRLQRIRDEHAAYIAGHEQDQERRLRRLAGLPDVEVAS